MNGLALVGPRDRLGPSIPIQPEGLVVGGLGSRRGPRLPELASRPRCTVPDPEMALDQFIVEQDQDVPVLYVVRDLAGTTRCSNGRGTSPVMGRRILSHEDAILAGRSEFRFLAHPAAARNTTEQTDQAAYVPVVTRRRLGTGQATGTFALPDGERVVLGVGPDCYRLIRHPSVLEEHAAVTARGAEVEIEDLSGGRTFAWARGRRQALRGMIRVREPVALQLGNAPVLLELDFRSADRAARYDLLASVPAVAEAV